MLRSRGICIYVCRYCVRRSHLSESFVGDVFQQLPSLFTEDSDDEDAVRLSAGRIVSEAVLEPIWQAKLIFIHS